MGCSKPQPVAVSFFLHSLTNSCTSQWPALRCPADQLAPCTCRSPRLALGRQGKGRTVWCCQVPLPQSHPPLPFWLPPSCPHPYLPWLPSIQPSLKVQEWAKSENVEAAKMLQPEEELASKEVTQYEHILTFYVYIYIFIIYIYIHILYLTLILGFRKKPILWSILCQMFRSSLL